MKTMHLLYDAKSETALRWRAWLDGQSKRCALEFVPYQAPESLARFAGIEPYLQGHDLVAVGYDGAVYPGAAAFVLCLAALEDYGAWANRLAIPELLPKAGIACALLVLNDRRLRRMMEDLSDQQLDWFLENQLLMPPTSTTVTSAHTRCR
jgi:hypothetical protein